MAIANKQHESNDTMELTITNPLFPGNKPYELELMPRLYVLQNLYALSDECTAAEVIDSRAFSGQYGTIRKERSER